MKNLELNQMESCMGGWDFDYGDMTCEEFWAGVGGGISLASPLISFALPGFGAALSIGLGFGAMYAGLSCD
jgi:hypothetical protein